MQVESNSLLKKWLDFSVVVSVSQNPGSAILELLQLRSISCPAIIPHYVTIIKLWLDYRILRANLGYRRNERTTAISGTNARSYFFLETSVMCVFRERCASTWTPRYLVQAT